MSDDLEVPPRLIDVLAKQMYGRKMRRRSWENGWDSLSKAKKTIWLDDARAAAEPMMREIADDLERRMMRPTAITAAIKAFNRSGLTKAQPIEEAMSAAFRAALGMESPRRTLAEAIKRLARAGKEISAHGGVGEAAEQIGCGEFALRRAGLAEDKTPAMALGVALGLLMAGDSEADGALAAIYADWQIEQEDAAEIQAEAA